MHAAEKASDGGLQDLGVALALGLFGSLSLSPSVSLCDSDGRPCRRAHHAIDIASCGTAQ
jgi:hypothetical protein